MGPSVKFVSPISGLISGGKNGGKFFFRKKCHTWGGVGGGDGKRPYFFPFSFLEPFPYSFFTPGPNIIWLSSSFDLLRQKVLMYMLLTHVSPKQPFRCVGTEWAVSLKWSRGYCIFAFGSYCADWSGLYSLFVVSPPLCATSPPPTLE